MNFVGIFKFKAHRVKKNGQTIRSNQLRYMIMPEKYTYKEFEKQFQELEQEQLKQKRKIKALQKSLDRHRIILNNLPLAVCSFVGGGRIMFVNEAYCNYFAKTPNELVGSNFLSLIPESDHRKIMENISALTVESPTQSHEHSVIAPNGVICWQRWTNRAIFDVHGQVVEYYAIGEDISKRKKQEQRLKESEELHRITLSNISDAVFITDNAGVFTYICPNVSVIFGYSYEEVIAFENIKKLLGTQLIDVANFESAQEISNIECAVQDKFGVTHNLLVNVKLVSIKNGTMLYTCRDITERKNTENALKESEEKYRQLFNNESDAVMIFDAHNYQFEDANPATLALLGYSKEEFLKLTVEDISAEKDKTKISIKKTISGGPKDMFVPLRYFIKKNGEVFPGEIHAGAFIMNKHKKIIGAVRDITKRIEAEETVRKLSVHWISALEMERKRIAYDLHDDLGQSLALLKLKLSNIQNKFEQNQAELISECKSTLNYTDEIIEKVRTLAHGLANKILDDVGLTASLKLLFNNFSHYSNIQIQKKIGNIDGLFPQLSEITIYRIFQEIFTNIEKHSKADYVNIVIKKQSGSVSFEVEDAGKGFDIHKVKLNYQNEKGLGLFSIKDRIQILGGSFDIKSQLKEGTKINFTVPYEKSSVLSW
jgi:PAS domain S-box-containing protein